jgi:hypothetical protein
LAKRRQFYLKIWVKRYIMGDVAIRQHHRLQNSLLRKIIVILKNRVARKQKIQTKVLSFRKQIIFNLAFTKLRAYSER